MASSDRFEAVLELGQKLAAELGGERDATTLTRWMAHYIAELIEDARAAGPQISAEKRAHVASEILKLWSHHPNYGPGRRPFEAFEPAMRTLESLDPDGTTNRYHNIWSPREPLPDDEKEAKKWLDAAMGIDKTARIVLRLFLRQAVNGALDKSREWVELAVRAGVNNDPTVNVVRFMLSGTNAPPQQSDEERRRQYADSDIARLESFAMIAATLAQELRKQLADGTYPDLSEMLDQAEDESDVGDEFLDDEEPS